jgi:hypothetical protein
MLLEESGVCEESVGVEQPLEEAAFGQEGQY